MGVVCGCGLQQRLLLGFPLRSLPHQIHLHCCRPSLREASEDGVDSDGAWEEAKRRGEEEGECGEEEEGERGGGRERDEAALSIRKHFNGRLTFCSDGHRVPVCVCV